MFSGKLITSTDFIDELAPILMGKVVLLISSAYFTKNGITSKISHHLTQNSQVKVLVCDAVRPNPELVDLYRLQDKYMDEHVTDVIALGGGSVMDSAKALSFVLANPDLKLLSVLQSNTLYNPKYLNLICIPTTSGTGSEITPFATIWDTETQKKYSLSHITSHYVIHDASLTLALPRDETLYSALDALSHALESLWNKNSTFLSRVYAEKAIALICEFLPITLTEPNNFEARQALQQAALLSGLAISITKTAIAHAISYPLTLQFNMPHGLACSFTLSTLINVVGGAQLKISLSLADKILDLMDSMELISEVIKFASKTQILTAISGQLDPSRAGNFILPISEEMLKSIIQQSLEK